MPVNTLLQENQKFEIQVYKRPKDTKKIGDTHVAFSGSPLKHPYQKDRVILVVDPFSSNTLYYEFYADDISYAEDLGNLVNLQGKSINIVRIWVKKSSIGLRCTPFVVEDTRMK